MAQDGGGWFAYEFMDEWKPAIKADHKVYMLQVPFDSQLLCESWIREHILHVGWAPPDE